MKHVLILILLNSLCMTTKAQPAPILNDIAKAQKTKVWKLEQLAKLLTQKGATLTNWQVELWRLGYKAALKITETDGQVYKVYVESYLASDGDKVYIDPQSKQARIGKLYRSIDASSNSEKPTHWLNFFDKQQANVKIAEEILDVCPPLQNTPIIAISSKNVIKISYSNWLHARSIDHKKDYHMLSIDFTIAPILPEDKSFVKSFVFNNSMRVKLEDGSSPQNKGCGDGMLAKMKELL